MQIVRQRQSRNHGEINRVIVPIKPESKIKMSAVNLLSWSSIALLTLVTLPTLSIAGKDYLYNLVIVNLFKEKFVKSDVWRINN